MFVYLVAIAEMLGYLSAVPVCAAFWLSAGDDFRFGTGLGAFQRRFALRRARRASLRPKRGKRRGKGEPFALRALGRLRGMGFSLKGCVGLGDAAATALACGMIQSLASALGARAERAEIDVAPLFDAAEPRAELRGMIRAPAGQIMIAAALSGIDALNRRIAKWTNIRSKAS